MSLIFKQVRAINLNYVTKDCGTAKVVCWTINKKAHHDFNRRDLVGQKLSVV
jgi:hypothetical protein